MNTLHFTAVDLEANREGRLTDAQRKKLNAELDTLRRYRRYALVGFIGAVALCTLFVSFLVSRPDTFASYSRAAFRVGLVWGAVTLVAAVFLPFLSHIQSVIVQYVREKILTLDGSVQSITSIKEGCCVTIWHKGPSPKEYFFENENASQYFEVGQTYRIYYYVGLDSFRTSHILSVEELPAEKAKR